MLNRLKDVFASLQKYRVKYIVIGGIAAVLHGVPRATFDLDILIEATSNNAQQLLDALFRLQRPAYFLRMLGIVVKPWSMKGKPSMSPQKTTLFLQNVRQVVTLI